MLRLPFGQLLPEVGLTCWMKAGFGTGGTAPVRLRRVKKNWMSE
jgi:hypothetical protein